MARQTSKMEGAEAVAKVLQNMPGAIEEDLLKKSLRAAGRKVRDEAEDWAPESAGGASHPEYGSLKDNIGVKTIPKSQLRRYPAAVWVHTGDAFWGLFHEFGTSKMAAHPWLRPAAEASQAEAIGAFSKTMVRGVKREADKLAGKYGMLGKTRTRRLARS